MMLKMDSYRTHPQMNVVMLLLLAVFACEVANRNDALSSAVLRDTPLQETIVVHAVERAVPGDLLRLAVEDARHRGVRGGRRMLI